MNHLKSILTALIIAILTLHCKEEKRQEQIVVEPQIETKPKISTEKSRKNVGIILKRAIRAATKKTSRVKIDSLMEDLMQIKQNSFFSMAIGDSLSGFKTVLEKDTIKMGKDHVVVYNLYDEKSNKMAIIYPESSKNEVIKSIEIVSEKPKTKEGIGLNMTFEELLKVNPEVLVQGSETSEKTFAINERIKFLLDIKSSATTIDNSKVTKAAKIKSIIIQ